MTPAQEQAEIERLVADLSTVITRLTTMISRGALSGGYRFKGGKGGMVPGDLVEAEVLRLAALEMIVMLTGDYDEALYESWGAVLAAHKKSLDKKNHKWTGK